VGSLFLSTYYFTWPAYGFLLGESLAGEGQPVAFTAPLQGAMIGWAVGSVLRSLFPFGGSQSEAPPSEKGEENTQERSGSPK
jgi:hypothetical protein